MGYLVITNESDLEAVAHSVLKARLNKAGRASALHAIRAANPGLNFSRLKPGAVVRIPEIDVMRDDAPIDGLDTNLDKLLDAVTDALKRLVANTNDANDANDEERTQTRRLLESEVGQLAARLPALKENVESVLKTYEEDANQDQEHGRQVVDAVDGWARQLEKLRTL